MRTEIYKISIAELRTLKKNVKHVHSTVVYIFVLSNFLLMACLFVLTKTEKRAV